LAPGQSRTGIIVPLQHGALLTVHVNDPGGQLPAQAGKIGGNELSVQIAAGSSLVQHVPIVASNSIGRDHAIVIPYGVAHRVIVNSTKFNLSDGTGSTITSSQQVVATRGGAPPSIVVNVGSRKQ
jgi:hypothetical protein